MSKRRRNQSPVYESDDEFAEPGFSRQRRDESPPPDDDEDWIPENADSDDDHSDMDDPYELRQSDVDELLPIDPNATAPEDNDDDFDLLPIDPDVTAPGNEEEDGELPGPSNAVPRAHGAGVRAGRAGRRGQGGRLAVPGRGRGRGRGRGGRGRRGRDEPLLQPYHGEGIVWSPDPPPTTKTKARNLLRSQPGTRRLPRQLTGLSLFQLFLTPQLLDNVILRWTKKYAVEKIAEANEKTPEKKLAWKPVTRDEIYAFCAILLRAGVDRSKDQPIEEFWSTSGDLRKPFFPVAMSRDGVKQILSFLRFDDVKARHEAQELRKKWVKRQAKKAKRLA